MQFICQLSLLTDQPCSRPFHCSWINHFLCFRSRWEGLGSWLLFQKNYEW